MILIDTTPLVALIDARDSHHAVAERDLERLATNEFATCESVLAEACFHLPARSQRDRLRQLLKGLNIGLLSQAGDLTFVAKVFSWLTKYSDHSPDWADAYIAVLSGGDRKLKVWTYDREFRSIWRRPDGSVIPLALRRTPP